MAFAQMFDVIGKSAGVDSRFAPSVTSRPTALRLWLACAFAEEIGIATEVFDRCKGDRFDAILDLGKAHGRKSGCPMSQRSDETLSAAI
jgi:hypothetical protein